MYRHLKLKTYSRLCTSTELCVCCFYSCSNFHITLANHIYFDCPWSWHWWPYEQSNGVSVWLLPSANLYNGSLWPYLDARHACKLTPPRESIIRQSCSDKCLRVGYKLYPLLFVYEPWEAIHITRHLNWDNRKVYFLVIGYWKCAAGWGRIFKTWIDYNVVPFSIVKNIPPSFFPFPDYWGNRILKNGKMRGKRLTVTWLVSRRWGL